MSYGMIMVYRILHGMTNIEPDSLFDTSRNVSTRGHAFKLNHTYARLDCRKHSFAVRTVAPWNALPQKVVESRKLIHFREALQETSDTLQRFLSGAVI